MCQLSWIHHRLCGHLDIDERLSKQCRLSRNLERRNPRFRPFSRGSSCLDDEDFAPRQSRTASQPSLCPECFDELDLCGGDEDKFWQRLKGIYRRNLSLEMGRTGTGVGMARRKYNRNRGGRPRVRGPGAPRRYITRGDDRLLPFSDMDVYEDDGYDEDDGYAEYGGVDPAYLETPRVIRRAQNRFRSSDPLSGWERKDPGPWKFPVMEDSDFDYFY